MKSLLALPILAAMWTLNSPAAPQVTVTENDSSYTLANGIVTARVNKRSGDLVSLKYKDLELLGGGSGHPFGYWSHSPGSGARTTNSMTIDPSSNNGERGEVSVKGFYQGRPVGQGPGGSVSADIEIRYALGRGDSGVYTYSIFSHAKDYPATSVGEARFGVKLRGDVFDHMTIDAKRNKLMPKPEDWDKGTQMNMKEARKMNTGIYAGQVEHKYDYSAIQFEIPAFGWSSTEKKVGLWFVNPSIEYLSGGATKVELTGHLDNNEGAAPTLLNYWRGSHYGGSVCSIAAGEEWTRVIGPFLIYCNSASDPDAMWKDALAKADQEAKAWPYEWVEGVDYPHKAGRGTVNGKVVLNDPQAPGLKLSNLLVGLAAPDYSPGGARVSSAGGGDDEATTGARREGGAADGAAATGRGRGAGRGPGGPRVVDWQQDAKYYEFWVRGDEHGGFGISNVRPGTYTLHAIADGVLGELAKSNITVAAGQTVDLGAIEWKPVRRGKQVWEIGVPNRSAEEFKHGDHYWQWGLYNEYAKEFPNDVNFVIGKSDPRKDWNYAQVPRARDQGTTWSINFDLPSAPTGKAVLRMGIAATSVRGGVQVSVNDQPAGGTGPMTDTATIRRDGIRGYWSEKEVSFDAALLRLGSNVLKLTIPAGDVMSGIEYDYLRLEVE